MTKTCILTDATVQFPIPAFTGRDLVNVIPLHVVMNGERHEKAKGIKAGDFPRKATEEFSAEMIAPSVEECTKMVTTLAQRYEEIVVILHSAHLSETYNNMAKAVKTVIGHTTVAMIDSHTTATGLGLIVLKAAEGVTNGMNAEEIESMIRELMPRMYTVFVIEGLTYLNKSEYLGEAQALVGEFLKMTPVFILDNGKLTPTQKARNYRHLVDLLHEFVCEFDTLEHIAFIQGAPPFESETRSLRERITMDFGEISISEHTISAPLAAMFGPRTLGMFILQSEEE